jgi:hypothetical protein
MNCAITGPLYRAPQFSQSYLNSVATSFEIPTCSEPWMTLVFERLPSGLATYRLRADGLRADGTTLRFGCAGGYRVHSHYCVSTGRYLPSILPRTTSPVGCVSPSSDMVTAPGQIDGVSAAVRTSITMDTEGSPIDERVFLNLDSAAQFCR